MPSLFLNLDVGSLDFRSSVAEQPFDMAIFSVLHLAGVLLAANVVYVSATT